MQPIKKKKVVSKKIAPAPLAVKKSEPKKIVNPLFEKRAKNFGIGECFVHRTQTCFGVGLRL